MPLPARLSTLLALSTSTAVVLGLAVVVPAGALPAAPAPAAGAPADPAEVWTEVDERPAARGGLRQRVAPSAYGAYHLDLDALTTRLRRAPLETAGAEPLTVAVPAPDGDLVEFAVTESPVMEPALAALHPDITTYAGRTTDGAPASIRLDVTPMGFHASVRGAGESWYVDPAYNGTAQGEDALYLSYLGGDLPEREHELVEPDMPELEGPARRAERRRVGEGGGAVAIQRTYRLALVTDPSYAAHFGTTSNAAVTAEKVTLINRVNQVYGDDLSIRVLLVAGTDALNFNTAAQFTGANGPCGPLACFNPAYMTDGCYGLDPSENYYVLDQNRYVLGQLIGADNYDVGHVAFGPAGDGGGIAGLGVVGTRYKAEGCTGLNPPTGDAFAIDYVAHELGHQFAGNHTFNGVTGSCEGTSPLGNREAATSVEPGSGSSVMAYAGICGVDNLQPHSDPYFSQRSQEEIASFTRSAPATVSEVQDVALSGFGTGESFAISYGGAARTVTSGTNYTAAGIKAAVEAAEPSSATATVTGLWAQSTALTAGFEVQWSGTADILEPTVAATTGTFTANVGTADNGGPETNRGFANPEPSGNRNPQVTAPAAKTIPMRTPFALTGSASDPDGDALVYTWEQNSPGGVAGTALNSNLKLSGPLFSIFGTFAAVSPAGSQQYGSPGLHAAATTPTRLFPDAAQVAAGETNAATGTCPTYTGTGGADSAPLRCYSEFLPTTARTMNFRLTARDLGGADAGPDGGTSFADTAITVGLAGPFLITSQAAASSVAGRASGTLAWNVAGTNTATYATDVKISFSTDGGLTFPTVLAESTPNDGSETIAWPNVATTRGRVKIEAVDNYFYDVSDGDITVTPTVPSLTTGGNAAGATFTAPSSDPLASVPEITAESNTVAGTALAATIALPPGLTGLDVTRTAATATGATFQVTGTATGDPGSYPVTVTVGDGDGNAPDRVVSFTVVVTQDAATLTYTGDTTGATGTRTVSATVADTDATPGTVVGDVAFTDETTGDALCTAPIASGVASCTFVAPVTRAYQVVGTLASIRYTGASPAAPLVVTGVVVPGDTTPPETRITAGPPQGSIQVARNLVFRFDAEAGATYDCSIRGSAVPCNSGTITLRSLAAGSYDFRVAATDAAGNTDSTPATRRFYVPVNDRALTIAKGPWKRRSSSAHYRGTYSTVSSKGATLTYRVTRATTLALVLSNGRGFGSVEVFLGNRRLVSIASNGTARTQRIAAIAKFGTAVSGKVRIVTKSAKPVRIEGLAIRTAAATARPAGLPAAPRY